MGGGAAQGGAEHFFMELGQLPAQGNPAVRSENSGHVLQGGQKLMGRFVEHHGAGLRSQGVQVLLPAFFCRGEEALKGEAAGGQAGDAQGRDDGAGTGYGGDGNARLGAQPDQVLAGVGDGGGACVGDQGAHLSGLHPLQELLAPGRLVVLVIADQGLFDLQEVQQPQGDPGVLRGDEVGLRQDFPAAGGDVSQIADGRRDQIQHTGHGQSPSSM